MIKWEEHEHIICLFSLLQPLFPGSYRMQRQIREVGKDSWEPLTSVCASVNNLLTLVPVRRHGSSGRLVTGGRGPAGMRGRQEKVTSRKMSQQGREMVQRVRMLALQPWQPEFDPRNPFKGGRTVLRKLALTRW